MDATFRQIQVFETVARHFELLARGSRIANEPAGSVDASQAARALHGTAAVRAGGQKNLLDLRRGRNAALQPRHHPAAQGDRHGIRGTQGDPPRSAQRRRHQCRRLLLSGPAGGVLQAARRRHDSPHREQSRRDRPPAVGEHDGSQRAPATAGQPRHRRRSLRAAAAPHRCAASPSARGTKAHPDRSTGQRIVHRARARIGHPAGDGRNARGNAHQVQGHHGNSQHRDDQARRSSPEWA